MLRFVTRAPKSFSAVDDTSTAHRASWRCTTSYEDLDDGIKQ